jgi:hypothetical protein
LFVIREDLKLNSEVDLSHADAVRNVDDRRGEVQDAGHTGGDKGIGGILSGCAGGGDHADRNVAGLDDLLDLIEMPDSHAADNRSDLRVVNVNDATHWETTVTKTVVTGESLA